MKIFLKASLFISIIFLFLYQTLGADTYRIGIVDIQKFQKKSVSFQKIRSSLMKKFEGMQRQMDEEKMSLIKVEEEFKKQSMMLSLDAKKDKQRELLKKRRKYKFLYEELTQEMKDAEMEAVKKTGEELEVVLKKIGDREGYTLIFEKKMIGLMYSSEAIDITDQVIQAYDRMKQ